MGEHKESLPERNYKCLSNKWLQKKIKENFRRQMEIPKLSCAPVTGYSTQWPISANTVDQIVFKVNLFQQPK